MYLVYILYFISTLLMAIECLALKDGVGIYQNISKEHEMIRPNVSSTYCRNKFFCGGNSTNSCYCDLLCEVMGDCCEGFKTNGTVENLPAKSQFDCYRMPGLSVGNSFGALVVAACPTDKTDDGSRSLCKDRRRKVEINKTYVSNDGVVFKNLFCAFCNGILPPVYSLRYLKLCASDSLDEKQNRTEKCNDLYDKRAQIDSMRSCPLKVKEKCPFNTAVDLSRNCTSGEYGIVYDSYGNMYRNIYCGICNDIPAENLSCEKDKVYVGDPYAYTKLIQNEEIRVKIMTQFTNENVSENDRGGLNGTKISSLSRDNAKMYLTVIALGISIVSLVITLIVYKCLPVLMNTPGKITFCLAISLFFAQLLFLVSSETEQMPWLCITMATLVHYFFLAAFCWMNIIAFDLWMTFAHHMFDFDEKRKFYYYSAYAWLVPTSIVTIAVIFNFSDEVGTFSPQYGEKGCWIFSEKAKLLLFIGPLALFKLFDIVAFSCTVYYIRKAKREASFARKGKGNTCLFFINLKLSLIMGLTWTFAFMAKYSDSEVLLYLFIIFNAFQGFFIFVCFVCTKRVFNLVRKSFRHEGSSTTYTSRVRSSAGTRSTSV
ncbi:probable G-protein coupled receptor Mth-like 1 [Mercenaria mercenaria]|uniref:probable G-protein coupled receptor Mth-like 1 n=1 Tax=Mercenaria mercenaria TaxID=6596 RepID=UPI00234EB2EB|nr:probable G-protein coupled receptor Mth-like 1 [Mercenaria mercenaria]